MIAPVFVIVALGVSEVSRLFDIQNQLAVAAREGARLASMDRRAIGNADQSTNDKITEDIRQLLVSNGLEGREANIFIVDAGDHESFFDFDNPANDLRLFEIRIELPYISTGGIGVTRGEALTLSSKVVFRNGRAPLANNVND